MNHPPYCPCTNCKDEERQRIREAQRLVARQSRAGHRNWRIQLRVKRLQRLGWTVLAISLSAIIAAYLVLTITAPDAIDSLMEEWARLFN